MQCFKSIQNSSSVLVLNLSETAQPCDLRNIFHIMQHLLSSF